MFQDQRGFTLLELLLVIALIGIGSAVVVYSLGPNSSKQHSQQLVWQMTEQLRLASDKAVLSQQPVGLKLTPDSYQFFRYDQKQWKPLQERFAPVHAALQLSLWLDGKEVDLNPPKTKKSRLSKLAAPEGQAFSMDLSKPIEAKKKTKQPPIQLFFNGDGIWPDFQLTVRADGVSWTISVDDQQQLVIRSGSAA